jgi:hypothetical protein
MMPSLCRLPPIDELKPTSATVIYNDVTMKAKSRDKSDMALLYAFRDRFGEAEP